MAEIRVNATGALKLYDSDDSNYVGLQSAGTVSSDITWTLPSADGSNGQVLTTNGSGVLSWASAGTTYEGIDDQSSSNDDQITITDTAVIINEDSDSIDFRVESNGDANCLIVDGSGDKVGIGEDVPEGKLHVMTGDASVGPNANADELIVEGSGHTGISILSGNSNQGGIYFGDSGDDDIGKLYYNHSDNSFNLYGNATNFLYMDSSNFVFNEDSNDINFRVESNGKSHMIHVDGNADRVHIGNANAGSAYEGAFFSAGNIAVVAVRDGGTPTEICRNTNDGNLINFLQGGSEEGNVSVSGSTVAYNTFMGAHWSQLADNSKPTILRGTVIESIDSMSTWYTLKFNINEGAVYNADDEIPSGKSIGDAKPIKYHYQEYNKPADKNVGDTVTFNYEGNNFTGTIQKETNYTLPKCKISDTEDSKKIYGVFHRWDDNDDGTNYMNDMSVASLGTYMIRIHKDETVAIGDYLQSKGDGTAKKQADDILRASTIGKVTSTEKVITHGDDSYCVPCTLHCG